jgi:hypothetical protein
MYSHPFPHDKLTKLQRKLYHGKLSDHRVAQVGADDFLVLEGVYDKDQHWLSFMTGALFLTGKEDYSQIDRELFRGFRGYRHDIYRYRVRQAIAAPVKVEKEYRKLVNYDIPEQLPLPFYEARKLTATEFKILQDNGFPGFDRDENGKIFKFKVKMAGWKLRGERKDAREWCEEMCHGRYYVTTTYAYFALAHDALLAKLAFG